MSASAAGAASCGAAAAAPADASAAASPRSSARCVASTASVYSAVASPQPYVGVAESLVSFLRAREVQRMNDAIRMLVRAVLIVAMAASLTLLVAPGNLSKELVLLGLDGPAALLVLVQCVRRRWDSQGLRVALTLASEALVFGAVVLYTHRSTVDEPSMQAVVSMVLIVVGALPSLAVVAFRLSMSSVAQVAVGTLILFALASSAVDRGMHDPNRAFWALTATCVMAGFVAHNRERSLRASTDAVRDAQKRMALAYERQLGADMEQMRAALVGFVAGEIRVPHTSLVSGLRQLACVGVTPEQLDAVNVIRFAAESVSGSLSDVDNLTRPARTPQSVLLEAAPFSAERTVAATVRAVRPLAACKAVDVELLSGVDAPEWVLGDRMRLAHIARHVLTAAVVHAAPQGRVSMVLRGRAPDGAGGPGLFFAVTTSNGERLTPQLRSAVFTPYYDAAHFGREGSLVYSLRAAHLLVVAHGGVMWVDSNASFSCRVLIPYEAAPPADGGGGGGDSVVADDCFCDDCFSVSATASAPAGDLPPLSASVPGSVCSSSDVGASAWSSASSAAGGKRSPAVTPVTPVEALRGVELV